MNAWDVAIKFVLEMEGGLTDDPNDPGGLTNFGISKKAYPNVDIRNLSVEQASDIYRRDYWNACRCDEFPGLWAIAIFDMAVNQGVGKAIRTMQATLGLTADGVIGPATIKALGSSEPRKLKVFLANRLAAYAKLMAANQNLLVYAVDWSFRVVALANLLAKCGD